MALVVALGNSLEVSWEHARVSENSSEGLEDRKGGLNESERLARLEKPAGLKSPLEGLKCQRKLCDARAFAPFCGLITMLARLQ